jgi:hypothetical protein
VPSVKAWLHFAPQSMPAGSDDTVPAPEPLFVTVKVRSLGAFSVKVAVTLVFEARVTLHVPLPEQPPPDQPVNVDSPSGSALSVTMAPSSNSSLHFTPQSMPLGELVTVPPPDPSLETVSVRFATKVAPTLCAWLIVTLQEPVPEHTPDHPVNTEVESGVAVSVTTVPWSKE